MKCDKCGNEIKKDMEHDNPSQPIHHFHTPEGIVVKYVPNCKGRFKYCAVNFEYECGNYYNCEYMK